MRRRNHFLVAKKLADLASSGFELLPSCVAAATRAGYDIDFGMDQLLSLLSSPEYADKLVGYMTVSVLMRSTDSQMTLVVQAIKNDLQSTQDATQCLALAAIANLGGKELAEAVAVDVQRILFSRAIFPVVRKKAALCLLRLVRISRELMPPSEWAKKLITLLDDKHLGVVLSVVTLILGLAEKDPSAYEGATGPLLVWLTRLAVNRHVTDDYVYHGTPCPWLQVRILRLLQMFPIPPTEAMRTRLTEVLAHILNKTEVRDVAEAYVCVCAEPFHGIRPFTWTPSAEPLHRISDRVAETGRCSDCACFGSAVLC